MKMIRSFRHKGLQRFYEKGSSGVNPQHTERVRVILTALDAATTVRHMDFPGSNLHLLKGKLRGFWSVKVNRNWRIIFRFEDGDAFDIDYLDYH